MVADMATKQKLPIQRCLVGECTHDITVRRIGKWWHCRVLLNGMVNQEVSVDSRDLIGGACREMLRWEDKCGNISEFASASRERNNRSKK
jgi:hypothetical protein